MLQLHRYNRNKKINFNIFVKLVIYNKFTHRLKLKNIMERRHIS